MEATLQSIFLMNFEGYREKNGLSLDQHQAANAIMKCGTEALGYEAWACPNGDHEYKQLHSCRHRSCPRCHGAQDEDWLERVKQRLLPCDHYHVVLTLPHELNPIWHWNRRWCADRLFKAGAETLRELLGDERYLGGEPGILAALHTWGRTLSFHPHLHLLVTGGGLVGKQFQGAKKDFLLPVGVIKAKFRGKWLSWLNEAYATGEIALPQDWNELDWRKALRRVAKKSWNVRIQGAYPHGDGVAIYLSRYVNGGPLNNRQLLDADDRRVRFRYRDHHDGKRKAMELSVDHFLTRVFWHVPVHGQHQVRYYGMYTANRREKRQKIRDAMEPAAPMKAGDRPEKSAPQCPKCSALLTHRGSVRPAFSYIRKGVVQQGVQAALERLLAPRGPRTSDPPCDFFGLRDGSLT